MSAILGNGSITFGDGTVQTTKTPTNISSFTNDLSYITTANLSSTYAARSTAAASMYHTDEGNERGTTHSFWYNLNGTQLGEYVTMCNCNC